MKPKKQYRIIRRLSVIILCVGTLFVFIRLGSKPVNKDKQSSVLPEVTPEVTPVPENKAGKDLTTTELPWNESEGNYVISNYSVLRPEDDYPEVSKLQLRLMELGYLESDEPGTKYNEATKVAIETYQRTINVDPTGVADSATQDSLFSDQAVRYEVRLGAVGTDVRSMQKMLSTLGYYEGKVNGYFGVATEEALVKFQEANALETDAKYNNEDRDLLYSDLALALATPTPEPTPTTDPKATKNPKASSTAKPKATKAPASSKETPKPDGKTYKTGGSFNATHNVSGVISVAEAQLGKRYVTGDEGPDTFDCSGLVYYCLKMNGVSLGRRSASSYADNDSWKLIKNMDNLERGDLLFFCDPKGSKVSHTGIYIGGGKMIDASSSRGEVVRRSCRSEYWETYFVCARRVF